MEEYQKNRKHKATRRAGPNQRGKQCWGKCKERLTFKSFGSNATKPDGLKDYCRDCEKIYRQVRNHINKGISERYRLITGQYRNYRSTGWQNRYAELRATGKITDKRRDKARIDRVNLRLVCGELMVCKPRKKKKVARSSDKKVRS